MLTIPPKRPQEQIPSPQFLLRSSGGIFAVESGQSGALLAAFNSSLAVRSMPLLPESTVADSN